MTHLRILIPRSAADLIMAMPLSDAEIRAASEEYISQMEALTFAYVITPIVTASGYICGYVFFYASGLIVAARTSAGGMLHVLARYHAGAAPSPAEAVRLFEQAVVTSDNAVSLDDWRAQQADEHRHYNAMRDAYDQQPTSDNAVLSAAGEVQDA